MKNLLFILAISFVFMSQSCIVVNGTKRAKSNQCQLHNVKMKKRLVGTQYGRAPIRINEPEYINARSKEWLGCLRKPWPVHSLAIKYVCKKCNKVKRQSKNQE